MDRRIQAATKAFGALQKKAVVPAWHQISHKNQSVQHGCSTINAVYYTECMILYRRHIKKLTWIQTRHLRQLLGVKWEDRVPDVEILERANTISVVALITASQLRWASHLRRMPETCRPKAVFYGELANGKRKWGGQKLHYKDVLKRHMKNWSIDDTWEETALDRTRGRATVRISKTSTEQRRRNTYEARHNTRHKRPTMAPFQCSSCKRYCRTKAGLVAHGRACLTWVTICHSHHRSSMDCLIII